MTTSKENGATPDPRHGGGREQQENQPKPTFWPIFRESNRRISCCPTLIQAAKVSHPGCVAWSLRHGNNLPGLFRHQYARLPRPLHEAAGAPPGNKACLTKPGRKPPCTECVEALLAAGADASLSDERGRSPLQRAAMAGCLSCIQTLLHSPGTKVDAICDRNSTALLEAVRINAAAVVGALLAPPASASVQLVRDEPGPRSALVQAVKAGAYDCITPLVEAGASLNPPGHELPLVVAAMKGTPDKGNDDTATPGILRLLVKLGADMNPMRPGHVGYHYQSAIHGSASTGSCSSLKTLLELGANPTAFDANGDTPLHLAASRPHAEACQLLVNHITDICGIAGAAAALAVKDKHGWSPLYRAVIARAWGPMRQHAASCVSMLLNLLEASGGTRAITNALIESAGGNGHTVVHLAAKEGRTHSLRALTESPEGLRVALEVADNDGLTPIVLAQQAGLDFANLPALAPFPWVPCCQDIAEAAENCHVTCVRHFLADRGLAKVEETGAVIPKGNEDNIESLKFLRENEPMDPMAVVSHDIYNEGCCSEIIRLLLEAGFCPDGYRGNSAPLIRATGDCSTHNYCQTCTRLLIEAGASGLFHGPGPGQCAMDGILYHAYGNDGLGLIKKALGVCDLEDDEYGITDVCNWAGHGYQFFELSKVLAEAGADLMATRNGRTAMHAVAELPDSEEYDYDSDYDDENVRDSTEHVASVEFLASKGVPVDAKDEHGNTPLFVAAMEGFGNVAAKLLDLGADPLVRNASGEGLLHMAALGGSTDLLVRSIDIPIDVNNRNNSGATALHFAVKSGKPDGLRVLLEEGGDINAKDNENWTPLRLAAIRFSADALDCLLNFGKGDVHQRLQDVGTLLHTAAYHGSTAVMQSLVDRGLDVASAIASNGETVLHNAAQNGQGNAVKWLLLRGASLDAQDHEGREPLASAIMGKAKDWGVRSVISAIAGSADGKHGWRFQQAWGGRSVLHLISAKGYSECVQFVIGKGVELDRKTTNGTEETAIHCATRNGHTSVVKVLAEAGASTNVPDAAGTTALHLATYNGHLEIATLLIEYGASCDVADKNGRTPLWVAAKEGQVACCSLLVARGADMAHRDTRGRNAVGASLDGSHGSTEGREAAMKLLIELGCPVGEAEVDAASRGGLTASFAKAVTVRMGGGRSTRQLVKATSMVCSTADASTCGPPNLERSSSDAGPAASQISVRISNQPAPTFSNRHRASSTRAEGGSSGMPSPGIAPGKVYLVDGFRLRQAVSQLEGPNGVDQCLLLKLLLRPQAGWAASYKGPSSGRACRPVVPQGFPSSQSHKAESETTTGARCDCEEKRPSSTATAGAARYPMPTTPLVSSVELSCNGDDFDLAGFEAVMEYLSTGQVVGATCGSIHQEAPCSKSGIERKVGTRAIASHRAAAFFGLPRLQSMVRSWLKANGAEDMEDDGTSVLCDMAVIDKNSGEDNKKRKFVAVEEESSIRDEHEEGEFSEDEEM